MKLVCPRCQCEFKPHTNGVGVIETMDRGEAAYRLWRADLWACPGCDARVVAGFSGHGYEPIAEHYQPEFAAELAVIKASKVVVIDNERPNLNRKAEDY